MAVTVTWEPLSDGRQLALFRPGRGRRATARGRRRRERARGQARRRGRGHAATPGGPARIPDHLALITPHGDRTYADLNAEINRLSRALRARGLQPGDAIALMCTNEPAFVEVLYAAQRTGLRLTPINWHLTGEEAALHHRELRGQGVRLLRHAWATRSPSRRPPAGRASSRSTRAATSPASRCTTPWWRPRTAPTSTDPVMGTQMLYTSGTTGPAQGRPPRHRRRERAGRRQLLRLRRGLRDAASTPTSSPARSTTPPRWPSRWRSPSSTACRW